MKPSDLRRALTFPMPLTGVFDRVDELIRLAAGKPKCVPFTERLRRAYCYLFGHRTTYDRWMNAETGEIAEIHVGCERCDVFVVLPPGGAGENVSLRGKRARGGTARARRRH